MQKRNWKQEEIENIIKLYTVDKMTINTIRLKYHCRSVTISEILQKNGVKVISHRATVNSELKHDYFSNIDTECKAYLLGFITADGNVSYRKRKTPSGVLSLTVQEKDIAIIQLLKSELNSYAKIGYDKRENKHAYYIKVTSNQIVSDLSKYYVVPQKTYCLERIYTDFENEDLLRHYLRGLIDGNGCITHSKGKSNWMVYYCGYNESLVRSFQYEIDRLLNFDKHRKIIDCKSSYRASWNGNNCKLICQYLYGDANYYLTRKYLKVEEMLEYKQVEDMV